MKYSLLLTWILAVNACSNAQNTVVERRTRPTPPKEDSVCSPNFPNNIALEADSIETFLLDGWKKDTSAQGLQGFKVEKSGKTMTGTIKQQFIGILKNPAMYQHDSIFKRCEFVPNVGFRWHSKGKSKVVLMALNCDVWKWYGFKANTLRIEADPAHDTIRFFVAKLFASADHTLLTRGSEADSTATDPFDAPPTPRTEVESTPIQVPNEPIQQVKKGKNHKQGHSNVHLKKEQQKNHTP